MKTKELVVCAMLLAIIVVVEYLDSLLNFRQVFSLALCGAITYFIFKVFGSKVGFAFYLSGSVLLFLIIPRMQIGIQYTTFFGAYSAIKTVLDKIRPKWTEICSKLLVMNLLAIIMYILIRLVLLGGELLDSGASAVFLLSGGLALQAIFLIYDFALSYALLFIQRRIYR